MCVSKLLKLPFLILMRWKETGLDNMVSIKYYFIIRFSHSLSVLQSAAITQKSVGLKKTFSGSRLGLLSNTTLSEKDKMQNH